MGGNKTLHYWEAWYPKAGATGILIGRGMIDPTDKIILHAAPDILTVEVSDEQGNRLAYSQDLKKTDESPMCLLSRDGEHIIRQDIWPDRDDYGTLVLLPGGEVGVLIDWWNAEDKKEWRWQIELYNSKR